MLNGTYAIYNIFYYFTLPEMTSRKPLTLFSNTITMIFTQSHFCAQSVNKDRSHSRTLKDTCRQIELVYNYDSRIYFTTKLTIFFLD